MNSINKEHSIEQTLQSNSSLRQCFFNQFKQKKSPLEISLELQQLLIHRRTNKIRQIQNNAHHILSREMFKTNKLPFAKSRYHQKKQDKFQYSNINMLKKHAAILMNQETKILGKENVQEIKPFQNYNNSIKKSKYDITKNENQESQRENRNFNHHQQVYKKRNKRKILKGRPDMYAMIKKKVMTQANEDEILIKIKNKSKELVSDVLQQSTLMKYVRKKAKTQFKQKNLSQLVSHQWEQSKRHVNINNNNFKRTSLATLTNFQNSVYTLKGQIRNIQLLNERQLGFAEKYPIKNRRYLSVNTNE